MNVKFLSLFVFCFLSGLQVCSAQTLKVALFNKEPMAWEENGKRKGFHYDIVQALSEQTGIKMEIQLVPVMRAVEMLRTGMVDFILLTQTKASEELHAERIFLYEFETAVFTLSKNSIQSKKELDAPIKLARVISGCQELDGKDNIQWLNVQSWEQGLDVLQRGRVRGFCSAAGFWRTLEKKKVKKDEVKAFTLGKKDLWLQVMPGFDKVMFKKLKDAVDVLIKSGRMEKIGHEYENLKPAPPSSLRPDMKHL